MRKILIINKNSFFLKNLIKTKKVKYYFITKKNNLNFKKIKKINPKIIFFPHWSFKIKKKIYENFICIGFHSTPLPYGRGGSPIQNMVLRNFNKTKICAFRITSGLDSGPVYLRENLNLNGDGHEIFQRMYNKIIKMINKLVLHLPKPKPQKGNIVKFKRLSSKNGEIKKEKKLNELYNLIRALDMRNEAYENAFIKFKNFKISFKEAKIKRNFIIAKTKIKKLTFN